MQELAHVSNLHWKTIALSNSVNFLDLTITIDGNGNISTKTYQKPMNLFLYIPPHSAHPPGLMKSLVFGLLNTYFLQNTFSEDFFSMVRHLFNRLINRGHKAEDLRELFLEAVQKIEDKKNATVDKRYTDITS